MSALLILVIIAVAIVEIAGLWQVFVKAGQPGWASIIPFYNFYILLKIVGRPPWWLVFLIAAIIPFIGELVALVVGIIVLVDLAKSFNKSTGFAVGLILLGFVFMPMLGFGPDQYVGPAAAQPRAI